MNDQFSIMKVPELKNECKNRGITVVKQKKDELLFLLREYEQKTSSSKKPRSNEK